jgi:putative redox protein
MEAHGVWEGGFRTRLDDGRAHTVTVDLPVEEDGTDAGTSSLELMVLSLAGCITTIFGLVAQRRKLKFVDLRVALRAERPKGAPTIERVVGTLEVRTEAAREEVETALGVTLRICPVGVLFERAHVPVQVLARVLAPSPGNLVRAATAPTVLVAGEPISAQPALPPGAHPRG